VIAQGDKRQWLEASGRWWILRKILAEGSQCIEEGGCEREYERENGEAGRQAS